MPRLPVSVVILAWNAIEATEGCLAALRETLRSNDQVIVVDNGSRDATPALLAGHRDWVDVIVNEENQGFARGCNQGAELARHEVVVFLNNDTLPTRGWVELLLSHLAPDVAAVGPMSNAASGQQQLTDPSYRPTRLSDVKRYASGVRSRHRGRSTAVTRLVGFCLLVRTEAFRELGGFDTAFGLGGCEDDDLALRLHLAGWRLLVAHDAFMHHVGHQSFSANGLDWLGLQQDNMQTLHTKYATAPAVSVVVLSDAGPQDLLATLVDCVQALGDTPFQVVLVLTDRPRVAEVVAALDGDLVVVDIEMNDDVDDEHRAWSAGVRAGSGLRRVLLRAGESVDRDRLRHLLATEPRATGPIRLGCSTALSAPG